MLLYFFPPLGGVAMSRNVRNVQYLPRYGWTPTVVTPRHPAYALRDPGSLDLIPDGTAILRTVSLEAGHVRPAGVRIRGALARQKGPLAFGRPAGGPEETVQPPLTERAGNASGMGRLERIRRLVFFPDDQVGWLPFAVAAAVRSHRSRRFDAVFSTSSPVTSHLAAGMVKRLTGVPWIAEFRDPWVGNALAPSLPWLHQRLGAKLEAWIARSADRIVCVTPSLTRLYQERYPGACISTITNGYDRAEAPQGSSSQPIGDERFRIVFTGTLDRPRELRIFLEGIDGLVARRPELADRLEIAFYGTVAKSCRAIADRFTTEGRLGPMLQFAGFVSRTTAMEALANADAALVLLGDGPGMGLFVGGKLYDYLGQDRQILAMVPPGDARDVLEGLGWGVIAEPDAADVGRAVERLLALPRPDRPADPERRYDRAVLAGQLAAYLHEAVEAAADANRMDRS